MTAQTNVKTVRDWFDGYNHQDLEAMMSLSRHDCVAVYPELMEYQRDEWKEQILNEFASFPDAHVRNLRAVGDDEYVSAEFDWTGTRTQGFRGRPASNTTYQIPCVLTFDLKQGKITCVRYYFNTALWEAQDK